MDFHRFLVVYFLIKEIPCSFADLGQLSSKLNILAIIFMVLLLNILLDTDCVSYKSILNINLALIIHEYFPFSDKVLKISFFIKTVKIYKFSVGIIEFNFNTVIYSSLKVSIIISSRMHDFETP